MRRKPILAVDKSGMTVAEVHAMFAGGWKASIAACRRMQVPGCQRVRAVCKPGSVLDRGRGVTIHLGRALPHASRNLPERSTRKKGRVRGRRRSYSVLLPVGFAVPPPLPAARCALTAPFHPDPQMLAPEGAASRRADCSLWHFPWGCPRRVLPGTVFPWSPDFPPGATPVARRRPERSPDRHAPIRHVDAPCWPHKRATASIKAVVSASRMPSMRCCRQCRWKAATIWVSTTYGRSQR